MQVKKNFLDIKFSICRAFQTFVKSSSFIGYLQGVIFNNPNKHYIFSYLIHHLCNIGNDIDGGLIYM